MPKTIFTGFAPNLTAESVATACGFLFLPWKWSQWHGGANSGKVEEWLQTYLKAPQVTLMDSGRSALLLSLQALGVGEGDEVLVQAFTCLVVINAITVLGATPIYVDINRSYNMSTDDLRKKITTRTKALIIQHTFGIPADLDGLTTVAKQYNILTVEDCAHALGAEYQGKKVGTFGDLAIVSFGSDKMVSCARGGAIITNNQHYALTVQSLQANLPKTNSVRLLQHLMHFPLFAIAKPIYHLGVGKGILWLSGKLRLMNRLIYQEEKQAKAMQLYPSQFPNALSAVLFGQLKMLDKNIAHRRFLSTEYQRDLVNKNFVLPLRQLPEQLQSSASMVRYPILVERPYSLYIHAKKYGIILGNWYHTVVNPLPMHIDKIQYVAGSCPVAERICKQSVNLPTDHCIGEKEYRRIIDCLNQYQP